MLLHRCERLVARGRRGHRSATFQSPQDRRKHDRSLAVAPHIGEIEAPRFFAIVSTRKSRSVSRVRLAPQTAVIDQAKLRDYVLSPIHPVGRFKAAFFTAMGYSRDEWAKLADDLRTQHLGREAEPIEANIFGTKYRIVGPLAGPTGRATSVVSIWIIRRGEQEARLVTLYPEGS